MLNNFTPTRAISEGIGPSNQWMPSVCSTTYEVPIFNIDAFARWHADKMNTVVINPLKTFMARWVRVKTIMQMEVVKEHRYVNSNGSLSNTYVRRIKN